MNRKLFAGIAVAAAAPLAASGLSHRPVLAASAAAGLAAASFYTQAEPEMAIAMAAAVVIVLIMVNHREVGA